MNSKMEAIILAGGLGKRLRSTVPDLPKPMALVAGRPFLEILLANLAQKGFSRIVLSVGYLAEKIITYFGDRFKGVELNYSIEEAPLGTGGAVRLALTCRTSDHVFVFNGDTYLDLEVERVEAHWQEHRKPIIVARKLADTSRYGRIELLEGRVIKFAEKDVSGSGLINAGCYVLPPDLLDSIPVGRVFSLEKDFLANAVQHVSFDCFVTHGKFIDIGVPEDYARAQHEFAAFLS
jgi:D-glycero-alpha-D-manno-heptose 1-phosphate guanylyltransferase